jgi:amidohydrolase
MYKSNLIESFIPDLTGLRRDLHKNPELSGKEENTARIILDFVSRFEPDEVVCGIGGHGLALIFTGKIAGPTVMLRCDMDALPIREDNGFSYKSVIPNVSHMCGHDGHMAILAGMAAVLSHHRPLCGRVVLLYQPAEETGQGASLILNDLKFKSLKPDYIFALHNLPGYPMGKVIIKPGSFNCASRGMVINLRGKTSHAAHPEDGISPAIPMCRIIDALSSLPSAPEINHFFSLVTVVYARLGKAAFGTAPGDAQIMATLRTETDDQMTLLVKNAIQHVKESTRGNGLCHEISWRDEFAAGINHDKAFERVKRAAHAIGIGVVRTKRPFRWSEDFGNFTSKFKGAMFGLGAGEDSPQLHNSNYDFPDGLIPTGISIFLQIVDDILKVV